MKLPTCAHACQYVRTHVNTTSPGFRPDTAPVLLLQWLAERYVRRVSHDQTRAGHEYRSENLGFLIAQHTGVSSAAATSVLAQPQRDI